jgi:hypothetical protein
VDNIVHVEGGKISDMAHAVDKVEETLQRLSTGEEVPAEIPAAAETPATDEGGESEPEEKNDLESKVLAARAAVIAWREELVEVQEALAEAEEADKTASVMLLENRERAARKALAHAEARAATLEKQFAAQFGQTLETAPETPEKEEEEAKEPYPFDTGFHDARAFGAAGHTARYRGWRNANLPYLAFGFTDKFFEHTAGMSDEKEAAFIEKVINENDSRYLDRNSEQARWAQN